MIENNGPEVGGSLIDTTSSKIVEIPLEKQNSSEQSTPEITRDQLALGKQFLNWRTLIPLLIVIIALAFSAWKAHIDPQKTWAVIRSTNLFFFLAAFLIYYLSFGIRALRWRFLLENVGFTKENGIKLPGFWKTAKIIYVSFFANAVIPARLGDLYRAYLLRQEIGVSTTRSFGTVLAERLLDLVVLLLLFIPAIIISLHENIPPPLMLGLELVFGAVIIGIVGLFVLHFAREQIANFVPLRFREHYYHFQEGTLGSFRRLPVLTGLTAGVWLCEAARFFFVAIALHLIGGSFIHIITAAVVIGLGEALITAIPVTGGGVGFVEGGMVLLIALFYQGPDAVNLTAAAILLDRIISLFSIQIIGFILFLITFNKKPERKR